VSAPLDLDAAFGELCKQGDVSLLWQGGRFVVRVRVKAGLPTPPYTSDRLVLNDRLGLVFASGKTLELAARDALNGVAALRERAEKVGA